MIFNPMNLDICLLRSSNPSNRNSLTVQQSTGYVMTSSLMSPKYCTCSVLLSGTKLIKAGCNHSRKRQKSAFLFLSARWPDCVIIPQPNLACVVRGIISSLKRNLNRPNLRAAFVCNLIKRVMTVNHAQQTESKRKSETLNSADYSHIRALLICKWGTRQKIKTINGLASNFLDTLLRACRKIWVSKKWCSLRDIQLLLSGP